MKTFLSHFGTIVEIMWSYLLVFIIQSAKNEKRTSNYL